MVEKRVLSNRDHLSKEQTTQKMQRNNRCSQMSLLGNGPAAGRTGLVMLQRMDHKGDSINSCHFNITGLLTALILLRWLCPHAAVAQECFLKAKSQLLLLRLFHQLRHPHPKCDGVSFGHLQANIWFRSAL